MAAIFKLVAGSSSLDLNDGIAEASATNYWLENYTPQPGPEDAPTVTEDALIYVKGTSASDMRTNLNALSAFIQRVNLWKAHGDSVDRVYLHFAPDGVTAGNARRSQVYKIEQKYEENWIDVPWRSEYLMAVTLTITRDNWGEAATEVTLPLTNTNGTDVTTGLKFYNCNDGSGSAPNDRCGYIHINDEDVIGDLPAGCKITIAGTAMSRIIMGCGSIADTTNALVYEAETIPGTTPVVDTDCSNGNYITMTGKTAYYKAISFGGYGTWFLPVIRAKWGATGAGFTLQNGYGGQPRTVYPTYDTTTFGFIPLVPIKIPPARYSGATQAPTLILTSSIDCDIDFIEFIPLDGGWRVIDLVETDPAPEYLYDDTMLDQTYYAHGSTASETAWDGPGIYLQPNRDQRIWVLIQSGTPGSEDGALVTANHTMIITYRPRYRSL